MPKDPVTVGPEKHEFLLQKRRMFSGHADRIIWIHRCAHTETQVEREIEILIEIEIEIEIEIDTETEIEVEREIEIERGKGSWRLGCR